MMPSSSAAAARAVPRWFAAAAAPSVFPRSLFQLKSIFSREARSSIELDAFLTENCSFTAAPNSSGKRNSDIDWKKFALAVDSYNSFLAKAIAGGSGHVVKGIFKCTNAYTNLITTEKNELIEKTSTLDTDHN